MDHQITFTFCQIDDFLKQFETQINQNLIGSDKGNRGPECSLSHSEIMTILILFQSIGWRNFKVFYEGFVNRFLKSYFSLLPSYNRFVELIPRVLLPMSFFAYQHTGKKTGIYYIDSTKLAVCELARSKRHKVFKEAASYGKTSVGWFFGLKLHLIINHDGELIAFKITSGNTSDNQVLPDLTQTLKGLLFGDKGYIGKKIAETLLAKGLKLITKVRKNMKKPILSELENQLLNKRGIIETIFGHLKYRFIIWHTRHRSLCNAMTHLMSALCAYVLEPLEISAFRALPKPQAKSANYMV